MDFSCSDWKKYIKRIWMLCNLSTSTKKNIRMENTLLLYNETLLKSFRATFSMSLIISYLKCTSPKFAYQIFTCTNNLISLLLNMFSIIDSNVICVIRQKFSNIFKIWENWRYRKKNWEWLRYNLKTGHIQLYSLYLFMSSHFSLRV